MGLKDKERKQQLLFFIASLLFVGAIFLIIFKIRGAPVKHKKKSESKVVLSETGGEAEKAWYAKAEQQLNSMNEEIQKISKMLVSVSKKLEEHEKKISEIEKQVEEIRKAPPVPEKLEKK